MAVAAPAAIAYVCPGGRGCEAAIKLPARASVSDYHSLLIAARWHLTSRMQHIDVDCEDHDRWQPCYDDAHWVEIRGWTCERCRI